MERIQFGGRRVAGFGVDLTPNEVLTKLEESDPCNACHHDTYSTIRVAGAVIASVAATAGIIYVVYKEKLDKRFVAFKKDLEKDSCLPEREEYVDLDAP